MTALAQFRIGTKQIGDKQPCFVIAEAGINHNGSLRAAKKMVDVARKCCADAIKFQTFRAEAFISDRSVKYDYISRGRRKRESMFDMFKRCEFSEMEWREIKKYCNRRGILFLSTPSDESDLDYLLKLGIRAIKVGSDDLVNVPLLEYYAKARLPLILSTGMANLHEVRDAVRTVYAQHKKLALLHCVSAYPTGYHELNLRRMLSLRKHFPDVVIGFSDHSEGLEAAIAAVTLGAKIYERHFTLNHNCPGPDHRFSADPSELLAIVRAIRNTEQALGSGNIQPSPSERFSRKMFRRSLVAARNLSRGKILRAEMINIKRPGTGIMPKYFKKVLGMRVVRKIPKNTPLKFTYLERPKAQK